MKQLFYILLSVFFLSSYQAKAQAPFTFECICDYVTEADSNCDICSSSIQSRLFCGLLIYKDSVAYKWIDAPYIIKFNGYNATFQEIIPSAETITISLFGTNYGTLDSLKDAVECPCNGYSRTLWYASDSINYAPISFGDTLKMVGRNGFSVTFDSLGKKYIFDPGSGGGSGTVTSVDATAPAEGFTISGVPITTSGTMVFTLSDDLAALEALTGTGIAARTAADTWALRTITAGAGISVGNGDGVSGNPTITNTGDLSSLNELQVFTNSSDATHHYLTLSDGGGSITLEEGSNITLTTSGTGSDGVVTIASTGGSGTVTSVDATAPASGFTITGVPITTSGTIVFALADDLDALESLTGTGISVRTAADTWMTRSITAGAGITVNNGNGVSGNPQIVNSGDLSSLNELQIFTNSSDATHHYLVLSDGGGSLTLEEGTDISLTTTGTGDDGIVTIAYTGSGGGVSGTGVANQGTYWTGTTSIGGGTWWTVDPTNGRHTISGINTGLGSGSAELHIAAASGASNTGFALDGSLTSTLSALFQNTSNTSGANMLVNIASGGTSAGDPYIQFQIPGAGGVTYSVGVDNTDSDKFKISPGQTSVGQTANKGIAITTDAATRVGINKDAPLHPLDVDGVARAVQWRNTGNVWSSGDISFGSGAGTGPTLNSIGGTNNGFQITFTTGTSPTANANIFTATYPTSFGTSSYPVPGPRNDPGGNNYLDEYQKFNISSAGAASFTMKANGTLTASTQYSISFVIAGY